jgi:hypothetical protein
VSKPDPTRGPIYSNKIELENIFRKILFEGVILHGSHNSKLFFLCEALKGTSLLGCSAVFYLDANDLSSFACDYVNLSSADIPVLQDNTIPISHEVFLSKGFSENARSSMIHKKISDRLPVLSEILQKFLGNF